MKKWLYRQSHVRNDLILHEKIFLAASFITKTVCYKFYKIKIEPSCLAVGVDSTKYVKDGGVVINRDTAKSKKIMKKQMIMNIGEE